MPIGKAGAGPGPLTTLSANGKNGNGGPNRGPNDGTASSALGSETSLSSHDVVRQLLAIARGDLSAVATTAALDGAALSSDGVGHPPAPTRAATTSVGDGGSSGGEESGSTRDPKAKAAAGLEHGVAAVAAATFAPRPVAVLRPPVHADVHVDAAAGTSPSTTFNNSANALCADPASACVSTDAEACDFYLTALVAHAMHLEDYWVDLRHQIEVDHHVEFFRFCADAGFGTLKTLHLLQWWRRYRALVRDVTATHGLLLSDGNPQGPLSPTGPYEAAYTTPNTAAAHGDGYGGVTSGSNHGAHGAASASSPASAAGGGSAKGGQKKGRRGSSSGTPTTADAAAATAAAAALQANAFPPFAAANAVYDSHDEAVRTELQRFVQWELEHEYEWRLVPREPFSGGAPGLLSPVGSNGAGRGGGGSATPSNTGGGGGGGGGNNAAAVGGATSAGGAGGAQSNAPAGKSSKADKAKMQLQQQQELEWEEQRLARVAALPAENIFLTKAEAEKFVRVAVAEDLASHAALHAYVAMADGRPTRTLLHAAAAPVFFSVQVEVPMPVLNLREAIRPAAMAAAAAAAASATPAESPRMSGDAAAGHGGLRSPTRAPTRPASSQPAKSRARGDSKNTAGATATAAGMPDASTTAEDVGAASQPRTSAVMTAMDALRAEQAKEAAAHRAAYAAELAMAAAQATQRQHAADVNLFFEKSSTQTAVQAVYVGMEDAVAARQQRILQRVAALEQALGLAEGEGAAGGIEGSSSTT